MQYPGRVGPITNNAATFGPEMVQGSRPDRPRLSMGPHVMHHNRMGLQLSQTTHVQAPLMPNMTNGYHPDQRDRAHEPRVITQRYQVVSVPTPVLTFQDQMVQGNVAGRPRLPILANEGWQIPPYDTRPFEFEGLLDPRPVRPRLPVLVNEGWQVSPPDVSSPLSFESTYGYRSERPRLPVSINEGLQATPPDINPFSVEMIVGHHPDFRVRQLLHWGSVAQPPIDVVYLSPEMFQGWLPIQPRLFVAPKRGDSASQLTHVSAPLGQEMIQGWVPAQSRAFVAPKRGESLSQTTHVDASFGQDMIAGSRPDRDRERLLLHMGQTLPYIEVLYFSPEMVQGSMPPSQRGFLPLRTGSLSSQTTHVNAAFGLEMVTGFKPDRNRERLYLRIGGQILPIDVVPLSVEMFQGFRPDAKRGERPRTGWSMTQVTHVTVPFGQEMIAGWRSDQNRERLPLRRGLQIPTLEAVLSMVESVQGSRPDVGRLSIPHRYAFQVSALDVEAPMLEMVQGSRPDTGRLWPLRRDSWIFMPSEATQTFVEMVEGTIPDRSRAWLPLRYERIAVAPEVSPFSNEMVQGWHSDVNRYIKPHVGSSESQVTPVDVLSPEMMQGTSSFLPKVRIRVPVVPLSPGIFAIENPIAIDLIGSYVTALDAVGSYTIVQDLTGQYFAIIDIVGGTNGD